MLADLAGGGGQVPAAELLFTEESLKSLRKLSA